MSGTHVPREAYDAAEVQDCHSQLRMCMQRIADVEAINVDLESRLEAQAREYIDFESEAAESCSSRASHPFLTSHCRVQACALEGTVRCTCDRG